MSRADSNENGNALAGRAAIDAEIERLETLEADCADHQQRWHEQRRHPQQRLRIDSEGMSPRC